MPRIFLSIFLIVVIIACHPLHSNAQSIESRTFPETRHTVRGDFLAKYESIPNNTEIIGFPITEEFKAPPSSPVAGILVQYFHKARFEYHPEKPEGQRVVIAPLGKLLFELYPIGPLQADPVNNPTCLYFPETQHQTCHEFLDFFNAHGGVNLFGYPISEIVRVNDRPVQYFENARFEWHTELPSGEKVVLTNLGAIYFSLYEDPEYLRPRVEDKTLQPIQIIQDLKVRAFPLHSIVYSDSTQTIYVIVQDQSLIAVPNVQVILKVYFPSGKELSLLMPVTDERGVTNVSFPVNDSTIGLVQVQVEVNHFSGVSKQTRTSFRIWW